MRGNILVIDDDQKIIKKVEKSLVAHNIYHASDLTGVNDVFTRKKIDLVFVDLNLEGSTNSKGEVFPDSGKLRLSGLDYIQKVRSRFPSVIILVLSDYDDVDRVFTASENGADKYIWKGNWFPNRKEFKEEIRLLVNEKKTQDKKREALRQNILGNSKSTQRLKKQLKELGKTRNSFFLVGEPGLCKEELIGFLHYKSTYYTEVRPYETVDCNVFAAEELLKILCNKTPRKKKELTQVDFLKKSNHNICVIKHIENSSWEVQKAFLTLIQTKRYLNSTKSLSIQFIFCLEEDPQKLISGGKLYPELFAYLLPEVPIFPIRERVQDLYEIIPNWLERAGLEHPKPIRKEILQKFLDYPYPGNLLELRSLLNMMLDHHKFKYPKREAWRNKPLGWSSLPPVLSSAALEPSDMHYDVAKLELSYIEKALQVCKLKKQKAAEALNIPSGSDNLKKSYIDKYWDKYPDLVISFPTIISCYKLDKK